MDKDLENFNPGEKKDSMEDLIPRFNLFSNQASDAIPEDKTTEGGEEGSASTEQEQTTDIKTDGGESEEVKTDGELKPTEETVTTEEPEASASSDEVKDALSMIAEELLSTAEDTGDAEVQEQSDKVEEAQQALEEDPTKENEKLLLDEINKLRSMLKDKDLDLEDKDLTITAQKEKIAKKDQSQRMLQDIVDDNKELIDAEPEMKSLVKELTSYKGGDESKITSIKQKLSPLIEKMYGVSVESLLEEKANQQQMQSSAGGGGGVAEAQTSEQGGFTLFGGLG